MRILLLTDGIHPYVMGGMQKHSYYLAKYLARHGVKVELFHCVGGKEIPQHEGADETYFTREELANLQFSCLSWPQKDGLPGHYLRENKAYSKQIFDRVHTRLNAYDLIYAQGYTGWYFLQKRHEGKLEVPIVVNFHGYEMYQQAPSFKLKLQHFLLRPAIKRHNQQADYVSSFGGVITRIIRRLEVEEKQILELPIGIEKDWLIPSITEKQGGERLRRFVFIGRYERRKGIEELNQVLKELLKEEKVNFEFHFIGPIPEEKRIQHPQIIYYGKIMDSQRIQTILRSCDVLVCPSYSEGMPTVILEGMASGLAILATKVGAIEKQLQGNGWLLERIDISLLKQAMIEACEIPIKELSTFQEMSIAHIRNKFLWDRVIELMLKEFKKIVNK